MTTGRWAGVTVLALIALVVVAGAAAAQSPPASSLQGFSIVLVQGDMEPGPPSILPPAAARAIDDMKDFVPFRSFRLIASSWILAHGVIQTRLKGPDATEYDVAIDAAPAGPNQRVTFRLRESGGDVWQQGRALDRELEMLLIVAAALRDKYTAALKEPPDKGDNARITEFLRNQLTDTERRIVEMNRRSIAEARGRSAAVSRVDDLHSLVDSTRMRVMQLEAALKAAGDRYRDEHPDMVRLRAQLDEQRVRFRQLMEEAQLLGNGPYNPPRAASATPLIDTTFLMRVGETVVVGTSRTSGGKALVAVLTAVSQSKGAKSF